ncbi:MAG: YlmC/YmxH family sporulation protein [Clostridiales bacterium]|nr:YlmC/YmxH family sporulation protein [Clostridiales bacterium]
MGDLICEVTFCELRCKQVVNVADGKCLGNIIDIVFDLKCGKILGLVAPGLRRFLFFRPREDIFIPWRCVRKIGDDVILVEMLPARDRFDHGPPPEPRVYAEGGEGIGDGGEGQRAETEPRRAPNDGGGYGDAQRYEEYYRTYDKPPKEQG